MIDILNDIILLMFVTNSCIQIINYPKLLEAISNYINLKSNEYRKHVNIIVSVYCKCGLSGIKRKEIIQIQIQTW